MSERCAWDQVSPAGTALQHGPNYTVRYLEEQGFQVSTSKTAMRAYSKRKRVLLSRPGIRFHVKHIERVITYKYLVLLHDPISWLPAVRQTAHLSAATCTPLFIGCVHQPRGTLHRVLSIFTEELLRTVSFVLCYYSKMAVLDGNVLKRFTLWSYGFAQEYPHTRAIMSRWLQRKTCLLRIGGCKWLCIIFIALANGHHIKAFFVAYVFRAIPT